MSNGRIFLALKWSVYATKRDISLHNIQRNIWKIQDGGCWHVRFVAFATILLNRAHRSRWFIYFEALFSCKKHQGKIYKTKRVLVANLATNFCILVASTIILVALATVLGATSCPDLTLSLPQVPLIAFTLSNARWFYSSMGKPSGMKGLIKIYFPLTCYVLRLFYHIQRLSWNINKHLPCLKHEKNMAIPCNLAALSDWNFHSFLLCQQGDLWSTLSFTSNLLSNQPSLFQAYLCIYNRL